ncbi:MAG: hypothetical protein RIQ41_69 [Candidatus Parcubacteria bacterium]|jgi:FAD/FMN-containing dehydrogenase
MLTASNIFSSVPPLFIELSKVIRGDLDCSQIALKDHGTDGSPYAIYPQAVLYPKTASDIKHAISFAREYRIPLTVCGGHTAASGGALGEGISIDLTRYFSHIRQLNMMDSTVTVDAGVSIDDLREKLSSWGMEVPVLAHEDSNATIGGMVATKSATQYSFYAGTIREWIEGITVVVDSGEEHHIQDGVTPSGRLLGIYQAIFPLLSEASPILRASRREQSDDATGYSLWNTSIGPRQLIDQLVGSEGTLAIITSITLRVVPKKKYSDILLLPIPHISKLESSISIAKHHQAEGLFLFDATYAKLVDNLHPNLLPKDLANMPYFLLVTLRGNDEELLRKNLTTLSKALDSLETVHTLDETKAQKLSSNSFLHSLFKDYTKGTQAIATSCEGIIVGNHVYADCIHDLDTQASISGRPYIITGYAGSGHISLSTSFDIQSVSYETDLQEYREQMFSVAASYKGGISAVSGDGLERTSSLHSVYNESTRAVFKRIKEAWDPLSIFNPSKKLGISKDYLVRHVTRNLDYLITS